MGVYTPWREQLEEGLTALQERGRAPFDRAKRVRAYSSLLIPGTLQSRSYIETIFSTFQEARGLSDEDVAGAVESRLERQQLMSTGGVYEFLIEESTLRNGLGGKEVMREQLTHLAELIATGVPSIGVLPMVADRSYWPEASFWLFDNSLVMVELVSGSVELEHPVDVAEYAARFSYLTGGAVYGELAHSIVRAALKSLG